MQKIILLICLLILSGCGKVASEANGGQGNAPALDYTDNGSSIIFNDKTETAYIKEIHYQIDTETEYLLINIDIKEPSILTINVKDESRTININWIKTYSSETKGQLEWFFGMTNIEDATRKQTENTPESSNELGHSDYLKKGYTTISLILNGLTVQEVKI